MFFAIIQEFFVGFSSFKHFVHNKEKTLRIMGTQGKNKHGDPILLLQFMNVLYMVDICVKFEKNLDSTSFSRELP